MWKLTKCWLPLLCGGMCLLKFYTVNNDYINYLRQFDQRIYENRSRRPYIGIVHVIGDINYYVPLSSPKPKHKTMKNSKDFHKINGGLLGALNFNYMIPVRDNDLILKDIKNEPDILYKNLLINQYNEILKIKDVIYSKAETLYLLTQIDDNNLSSTDKKIKSRCCDFTLLEIRMTEYQTA